MHSLGIIIKNDQESVEKHLAAALAANLARGKSPSTIAQEKALNELKGQI
jgi:hypothetical protein